MRLNDDQTLPNADSTPDPTPAADDAAQFAVPIPEAAERLGLTSEAIRMRLKRGTLAGAKIEGRWVVYVPRSNPDQAAAKPITDRTLDAGTAATQRETERANAAEQELIAALRSENAFLRAELASRTEEIQRRDHIIAGFIQRLPELPTAAEESRPRAKPAEPVDDAQYMPVQPAPPSRPPQQPRPWWKRLLGVT